MYVIGKLGRERSYRVALVISNQIDPCDYAIKLNTEPYERSRVGDLEQKV